MKVVGITGGIGSGKTTVCKLFELLGVPVFYADDEAKKLYDDPKIRARVSKLLGKQVVGAGKKIDKSRVAQIVFSDKTKLAGLNAIIHPAVGKQFEAWKKRQKGAEMVMMEAAIMIESGSHKGLDFLISITSPKILKIKRLLYRNNLSEMEIERRMGEQLPDQEREKYADAVIVNDEKHSLIEQVLALHKKLRGK